MYEYVDKMAERYKDKDWPYIDVLNEYIDTDAGVPKRAVVWKNIPNFECKLFNYVRTKFPNSKLIYNDFNFESTAGWMAQKSTNVYNFIKDMVDNNCAIDIVGF
jgi:GH35 family endo-1,4-beta-xylanase